MQERTKDGSKGARVRAVAATVVDSVAADGRSLDAALAGQEGRVAEPDRALLRMLSYGCLREHWQLREWLAMLLDRPLRRRDRIVESLLVVGLYQLAYTRIPSHAAVSATVEAARQLKRPKLAGLANAILRRFTRDELASRPPDSDESRYNHPAWLLERLRQDWPQDWPGIVEANDTRAPMWLRPNARRVSSAAYLDELAAAGIEAAAGPAGAIRLDVPVSVSQLPGFADGRVSVQDAAAQIAPGWLLAPGRGPEPRRILDACAAPGNKTAHLLEIGGERADVTAVDVDPERLDTLRSNLDRLRLSATVLEADASNPGAWWNGEPFDAILLDAPCSATGVIRRHPDIKLLRRASDIDRLRGLQAELLRALWPLLAPGGRLLYVTCSVLAAENDRVVAGFLDATGDARENDVLPNNNIRDVMRRKGPGYQVLPGTAGLDGFYFACLDKAPAQR